MHFVNVDLEDGADTIQVYDGNNASTPLLNTYTGTTTWFPQIVVDVFSSGNTMFVLFVTDGSETMDGFKIVYSTINRGKTKSFRSKLIDTKQWYLSLPAV